MSVLEFVPRKPDTADTRTAFMVARERLLTVDNLQHFHDYLCRKFKLTTGETGWVRETLVDVIRGQKPDWYDHIAE